MGAISDKHGKTSIRTFPKCNRGTMESGVQIFWLSLTGETPTGEYKREKKSVL
jgi:hypothetical protein